MTRMKREMDDLAAMHSFTPGGGTTMPSGSSVSIRPQV